MSRLIVCRKNVTRPAALRLTGADGRSDDVGAVAEPVEGVPLRGVADEHLVAGVGHRRAPTMWSALDRGCVQE